MKQGTSTFEPSLGSRKHLRTTFSWRGQRPMGDPSAVWALRQAMGTFKTSQSAFALSFMLRFAIHLVGDMHQPLHATQGVFNDSQFGDLPGDLGGNLIRMGLRSYLNMAAESLRSSLRRIKTPWPELTSLHLLWDAAGGIFLKEWPLVEEAWLNSCESLAFFEAELRRNASQIMEEWPRSRLEELNAADVACFPSSDCGQIFARWVQQVHSLAPEVYLGVREHEEVTDAWPMNLGGSRKPVFPRKLNLISRVFMDSWAVAPQRMRHDVQVVSRHDMTCLTCHTQLSGRPQKHTIQDHTSGTIS